MQMTCAYFVSKRLLQHLPEVTLFSMQKNMETFLENLRQATKCMMCRENREELKILKCFHVFCVNCLTENVRLEQEGNTFSCPLCKTNTCLPRGGDLSSLETSSLHSHIRKVLSITEPNEATSTGLPTCSCKMRNPSTSYCCNCLRYLCVQCFSAHELLNEGHKILDLEELQGQDYKLLFRQPSFCTAPGHNEDMLKYYCKTCKSCICEKCCRVHDIQGEQHDILDLETTADRQITIFREQLRQLEEKEAAEMETMKRLEDIVAKTRRDAEDEKTKVVKAADDLVNFIEENKAHLLRQIDEKVKHALTRQDEHACLLQRFSAAKEHVTQVSEYASTLIVVNDKDSIQERLRELCAVQENLDDIDNSTLFHTSSAVFKLQETGLGSVGLRVGDVDVTTSLVSFQHNLQALDTISLTVLFRDVSWEPCASGFSNLNVKIDPSEDVKNVKVSENVAGACSIEFVPKVPGHFTVSVRVYGEHVSNSPMSLDVKPQELKTTGTFALTDMTEPLEKPLGIAINKSNTKIAITDYHFNCIAIFNIDGKLLNIITGRFEAQVKYPHGVAFLNDNDIVISDRDNHRIVAFDTTTGGLLMRIGRSGKRPGYGQGEFNNPRGVHVDEQGHIIVCDADNQRVQVFTGDGGYLFQLDENFFGTEDFVPSRAISHGNLLIVSDWRNGVIHVVEDQQRTSPLLSRRFIKVCLIGTQGTGDGELGFPHGLAVDRDGNLLVCDGDNNRIQKFTLDGRFVGKTCKVSHPLYLIVLADGRKLFTGWLTNDVKIFV